MKPEAAGSLLARSNTYCETDSSRCVAVLELPTFRVSTYWKCGWACKIVQYLCIWFARNDEYNNYKLNYITTLFTYVDIYSYHIFTLLRDCKDSFGLVLVIKFLNPAI